MQKLETELIQEQKKSFKDKLMVVAETLRNNNGIIQCHGSLYSPGMKKDEKIPLCAIGLLGFRAGIPLDELNGDMERYISIFAKYGFDMSELGIVMPIQQKIAGEIIPQKMAVWEIFKANDSGRTFEQIADDIENYANQLP